MAAWSGLPNRTATRPSDALADYMQNPPPLGAGGFFLSQRRRKRVQRSVEAKYSNPDDPHCNGAVEDGSRYGSRRGLNPESLLRMQKRKLYCYGRLQKIELGLHPTQSGRCEFFRHFELNDVSYSPDV